SKGGAAKSCGCDCDCGCGTGAKASNALGQAANLFSNAQMDVPPDVPGIFDGRGEVNPANGNLIFRWPLSTTGAFGPTPLLIYNSFSPATSEFGFGWGLA